MADVKLLTIFGATGTQGGSVIELFLARSDLQKRYSLRGVTRDVASAKAKVLASKGIAMISATLNDVQSLKAAVRDSHGVFGLTNYWDKDVLDKQKEIQQGKNIFEACKAENVEHLVFSTLPFAEKLSAGELSHVSHFDSKAMVAEFIEKRKGDMLASYFMPAKAMYLKSAKDEIRAVNGTPALHMPFANSKSVSWPFIEPKTDSGKFIWGLFEAGQAANGKYVHAVSAWTTVDELLRAISDESGKKVVFNETSVDAFREAHPSLIAEDLTQTMLLVGKYSYYGEGQAMAQGKHDRWLLQGTQPLGLERMVGATGPWQFK